jgi:AraC-like DNA-binding protein
MPDIMSAVFSLPIDLFRVVAPPLERWNVVQPSLPCWRLWWNSAPGACVSWRNKTIHLGPGKFVLVAPETRFTAELRRPVPRHLFIHFGIGTHRWRLTDRVLEIDASAISRALGEDLLEHLTRAPDVAVAQPWRAIALVCSVLEGVDSRHWNDAAPDPRIQRVLAALELDPAQPWTNVRMARLATMSAGGFVRRFQRDMRTSPQRHLTRLRLARARALLLETDQSIEAVTERCGFCDRSYFSTVFRREVGLPPATFRARARALP